MTTVLGALVREARPRQWTKNLLVFAAPAAGGVLLQAEVLTAAATAFIAFCLAASGTYYLNDAVDAEGDRLHPRKRLRPVAAGEISVPAATAIGVVLLVLAVLVASLTARPAFAVALVVYVLLTVAYSLGLKHMPIVDIVVVAAGFVIRAAAGGLATGVPLSDWFLLVASFGALFIVTGKRHAEVQTMGAAGASHRTVLEVYTPEVTRHILTVASALTLITYCLWAVDVPGKGGGGVYYTLSIVPFVGILLRYAMLVFSGKGGEPEEILLGDRGLQLSGAVWVLLLSVAVALG